jgi:hypothetical protein
MTDPLWYRYNGAVMVPMRPELAEAQFVPDYRYLLEAHHERSHARHRAYFASLHEAWQSLASDQWPTTEHLRKYALIRTGWRDERVFACESREQAERMAVWLKPFEQFAVITTEGTLVRAWTARSQSYKAMGRDDFNRSMDDVLDYVAGLLGIPKDVLAAQGAIA